MLDCSCSCLSNNSFIIHSSVLLQAKIIDQEHENVTFAFLLSASFFKQISYQKYEIY